MTARADHDHQEALAAAHAACAINMARAAIDLADNGRVGPAVRLILGAQMHAAKATERAWPFLDE